MTGINKTKKIKNYNKKKIVKNYNIFCSRALFLYLLEKRQKIFLYWFASEQQTSTLRRKKYAWFYSNVNE